MRICNSSKLFPLTITRRGASDGIAPRSNSLSISGRTLAASILLSMLMLCGHSVSAAPPVASLSSHDRANLESLLRQEVDEIIARQRPTIKAPLSQPMLRSVRVNTDTNSIIIDLSVNYLPADRSHYSAELQDRLHQITSGIIFVLEDKIKLSISGVSFKFDGKDLFFYYPDDMPRPQPASTKRQVKNAGPVVVSAGHGLYLHHGATPDWRFQREVNFGVLEDLITQPLASELGQLLIERSEVAASFVRTFSNDTHLPSGEPWNDLAARYYLADTMPTRIDIWNSLPGATNEDRERDEDIRSRPFFANDIDAAALLSVHTNGFGTPEPRGARVYHAAGRLGDQALANSMLCYMREIIHAQEGYEDFPVSPTSHSSTGHGENNFAQVPAVIIETAFHSNPDDAAALLDPIFRTAAMKGVEKGYRLHNEEKPCEHFGIVSIPDVIAPQNAPPYVAVHYEGYPQFPVNVEVKVLSCPSGYICHDGDIVFTDDYPSPLYYSWVCVTSEPLPPSTFRVQTTLFDVDNVKTDTVEHNVTCTPPL